MGTRQPKKFPVSTLKAMAACHAVGLTYHAHLVGETTFWAIDGEFYHVVKKKTTAGVAHSAHYCQSYRSLLAEQLGGLAHNLTKAGAVSPQLVPQFSREYTQIELVTVCPSWLCDQDDDPVIVGDPAEALAQVWIEGRK